MTDYSAKLWLDPISELVSMEVTNDRTNVSGMLTFPVEAWESVKTVVQRAAEKGL